MDFKNDTRHMVDVLFVLTLFFVFALSALTLVVLGANVYRTTVNNMNHNFDSRTAYAYVTQKLRQSDYSGAISISTIGDREACVMTEEVNGTVYCTYLYEYDGSLYELLARADIDMEPSEGTPIIGVNAFDIEEIKDNLYRFNIITEENDDISFSISTHSKAGGASNE